MRWGIALGVVLLAAAAWPADVPSVRLPQEPGPFVEARPVPAPAPVATEKPRAGSRSRDPDDPQPPPEPSPPPPPKRLGTVLGNVEDEAGCAIVAYRIHGRRYGRRGRRRAGEGTVGPGGTFRFHVINLDFGPREVPPGCEPDRKLFTVWADGYVAAAFRLDEDTESALRRNERLTGIRIVLERAVVVEGRAFLPDGHPAPGQWLGVYRSKTKGGYTCVTWAKTNDQGWYRFSHLRPEPDLHTHASASRKKPDRVANSPYVPVGDDPVAGEIVHVDVRLGPWVLKK